jgi:acetyltransferase-like isoleucine patch superfamily enzyme
MTRSRSPLRKLARVARRLSERMRRRWKRDLPLNELLGDRWMRAERLGFGAGSSVYDSSYVYGEVTVGEDTWIGPMTLLDGTGGLSIGRHCSISAGVQIYTHDTVEWAVSGGQSLPVRAPVSIGDCCYIGSQTVIAKGVTIGDHAVIGACSFVNRDIPPWTVAAGVPCRPIGRVQAEPDGRIRLVYDHIPASPIRRSA